MSGSIAYCHFAQRLVQCGKSTMERIPITALPSTLQELHKLINNHELISLPLNGAMHQTKLLDPYPKGIVSPGKHDALESHLFVEGVLIEPIERQWIVCLALTLERKSPSEVFTIAEALLHLGDYRSFLEDVSAEFKSLM